MAGKESNPGTQLCSGVLDFRLEGGVFLGDLSHFDSSLTSPCCLCIVGVRFIDKTVLCSRTTCVLTVVPTTV